MIVQTLTVRLDQKQSDAVAEGMGELGYKAATKYLINCGMVRLDNLRSLGERVREVETLKLEVQRLKSVIDGAREAAAVLIDRTGQQDLLADKPAEAAEAAESVEVDENYICDSALSAPVAAFLHEADILYFSELYEFTGQELMRDYALPNSMWTVLKSWVDEHRNMDLLDF